VNNPNHWPGDEQPQSAPPGYGTARDQAREQVRPQPQYDYSGSGQPPPPQLPVPVPYAQGQPQPYYHVAPKSPGLGVLASFFIPGLGSMISGRGGKGAVILISYVLSLILTVVVIGFITAPIVWIVGMVTGYQDAQQWNRDHGILS
jgi:TM2 domain-containing membrane protein YozV